MMASGLAQRPVRIKLAGRGSDGAAAGSRGGEHDQQQRDRTGHRHKDKDYNIIWFTKACLSNALRLETYIQDAERDGDTELAGFFRKAQAESRKGAEQGKQLLRQRLGS